MIGLTDRSKYVITIKLLPLAEINEVNERIDELSNGLVRWLYL